MKIVADENIAQVAAAFAGAGELVLLPGRAIDAGAVRDADALLVRSVTRVDQELLAGSRCRFVGSATSGTDHVDLAWLKEQGIAFSDAPGSNAYSVVNYVFAALAALSERDGSDWRQLSWGIVGCGQIGGRLAVALLNLGCKVAIYDPFLAANHHLAVHFTTLDKVLQQDVVTLHTPLTRDGPHPTWHLLNAKRLRGIREHTVLINAARGAVVDNAALLELLNLQPGRRVVLDAWESEPAISGELLRRVALGTAHIAGYSAEGKLKGTVQIAGAFARHFGVSMPHVGMDYPKLSGLAADKDLPVLRQLNQLVLQAYDIRRDDAALRQSMAAADPAREFERLRKNYPIRYEFPTWPIAADGLSADAGKQARRLGFCCFQDLTAYSGRGNAPAAS